MDSNSFAYELTHVNITLSDKTPQKTATQTKNIHNITISLITSNTILPFSHSNLSKITMLTLFLNTKFIDQQYLSKFQFPSDSKPYAITSAC